MDFQITQLFDQFDIMHILSDECKMMIMRSIKIEQVRRYAQWLKIGQICRRMAFVQKGMFVACYYHNANRVSCQIIREGELCIAPASFFQQTPSEQSIEAIEDSVVFSIDSHTVRDINRLHPEFRIITETYLQNLLIAWDQLSPTARIIDAQNRFNWLKSNFPEVLYRVPKSYLSSFMGLSSRTLYKLK